MPRREQSLAHFAHSGNDFNWSGIQAHQSSGDAETMHRTVPLRDRISMQIRRLSTDATQQLQPGTGARLQRGSVLSVRGQAAGRVHFEQGGQEQQARCVSGGQRRGGGVHREPVCATRSEANDDRQFGLKIASNVFHFVQISWSTSVRTRDT